MQVGGTAACALTLLSDASIAPLSPPAWRISGCHFLSLQADRKPFFTSPARKWLRYGMLAVFAVTLVARRFHAVASAARTV